MPTSIKKTVITKQHNSQPVNQTSVKSTTNISISKTQLIEQIIFFSLGALEVLLGFRFVLKLMGASQSSGFVTFIYGLSNILISPFEGIFRRAVTQGIETSAIVEPATIVAAIVYVVLVWGIISLLRMLSGESQTE